MGEMPGEVRVSGQRFYDGRVVKLDVDQVRLPDGHQTTREVIRHPGATVIVPLLPDGRVLMIRQYRYAAGQELLELPAGTLDPTDPDPLACAKRELVEETGHSAAVWVPLGSFYTTPGFTTELIHCFLARELSPSTEHTGDEDERIEIVTLPLSSALTLARQGQMRDAKTMVGLFLAEPWA
jgi:ADP-ribose pyrophosphatase